MSEGLGGRQAGGVAGRQVREREGLGGRQAGGVAGRQVREGGWEDGRQAGWQVAWQGGQCCGRQLTPGSWNDGQHGMVRQKQLMRASRALNGYCSGCDWHEF